MQAKAKHCACAQRVLDSLLSITYKNGSLILLAMLRHCQREYLADFKLAFEDLGARKGGLELKDKEEVGKDWGGGQKGRKRSRCLRVESIAQLTHCRPLLFPVVSGAKGGSAGISGRDGSDI